MTRRTFALIAGVIALSGLLSGCDDDGWDPEAQFAPSLRPAFGARVTDDKLVFWTGTPCEYVTGVMLFFDPGVRQLDLRSPGEVPIRLEYLTLGGPYPGLEVEKSLPPGFDWHNAKRVEFLVYPNAWGSFADIAEVVNGSGEHPEDTFWFQDVGWLDAAQVAELNGSTFLTPCTADPAKR